LIKELEAKCSKKKGKINKYKGEIDVIESRYEEEIKGIRKEYDHRLAASEASQRPMEDRIEKLIRELAQAN